MELMWQGNVGVTSVDLSNVVSIDGDITVLVSSTSAFCASNCSFAEQHRLANSRDHQRSERTHCGFGAEQHFGRFGWLAVRWPQVDLDHRWPAHRKQRRLLIRRFQ